MIHTHLAKHPTTFAFSIKLTDCYSAGYFAPWSCVDALGWRQSGGPNNELPEIDEVLW